VHVSKHWLQCLLCRLCFYVGILCDVGSFSWGYSCKTLRFVLDSIIPQFPLISQSLWVAVEDVETDEWMFYLWLKMLKLTNGCSIYGWRCWNWRMDVLFMVEDVETVECMFYLWLLGMDGREAHLEHFGLWRYWQHPGPVQKNMAAGHRALQQVTASFVRSFFCSLFVRLFWLIAVFNTDEVILYRRSFHLPVFLCSPEFCWSVEDNLNMLFYRDEDYTSEYMPSLPMLYANGRVFSVTVLRTTRQVICRPWRWCTPMVGCFGARSSGLEARVKSTSRSFLSTIR